MPRSADGRVQATGRVGATLGPCAPTTRRTPDATDMRPRRLLMATFDWPPRNTSGVQRPLKFAKYLPRYGWQPTVVAADRPQPEDDPGLALDLAPPPELHWVKPWGDAELAGALGLAGLPLLGLLRLRRRALEDALVWRMRRFLHFPEAKGFNNRWIIPLALAILRRAGSGDFGAVWLTAPPPSMWVVTLCVARRTRLPVVLDLRDPWTANFTYELSGVRDWMARRIEARALRAVSAVTVASPGMQEDLVAAWPGLAGRVFCLPNGYDPSDVGHLLGAHRTDELFIVCLTGQSYEDASGLIQGIRLAVERAPAFRRCFRFRWVGCLEEDVRHAARNTLGGNAEVRGRVSHEAALRAAAESDALWLEVPLGDCTRYVVCGKTYEYAALRKPILGTAPLRCDARTVLAGHPALRLIHSRRPKDIASLLLTSFREWQQGRLRGGLDERRTAAYRRDVLAGRLAALLDALSRAHRRRAPARRPRDV